MTLALTDKTRRVVHADKLTIVNVNDLEFLFVRFISSGCTSVVSNYYNELSSARDRTVGFTHWSVKIPLTIMSVILIFRSISLRLVPVSALSVVLLTTIPLP